MQGGLADAVIGLIAGYSKQALAPALCEASPAAVISLLQVGTSCWQRSVASHKLNSACHGCHYRQSFKRDAERTRGPYVRWVSD